MQVFQEKDVGENRHVLSHAFEGKSKKRGGNEIKYGKRPEIFGSN